jgi:hypothetical protein
MKRALLPLAVGCVLVGIVAIVLVIVGWRWSWFALANGALAVLMLALFRGSITGEDADRPPGVARVSAARAAGPLDPDTLGAEENALYPDLEAAADARAEDISTGFAFLWTAAVPAAAAILALVFYV